jgi:hypothetical protein
MPERIVALADAVSTIANGKVREIQRINAHTHLLALNAQVEAARAGTVGAGFAVVAQEVRSISQQIDAVAGELTNELKPRLDELDRLGQRLVSSVRGTRLADLALNMIEIIDRNLYERSCDVRWWATDSAVVEVATDPTSEAQAFASKRLGIILDSYTVYCDLVVCDLKGRVLAHGRPQRFPNLKRVSMADQPWFRQALETRDGTEFAVADVYEAPELEGRAVATYSAAIRARGETNGAAIGVLGIFFDWASQAQSVVDGVRLSADERATTRCLIVDARRRVLAASDRTGVLRENIVLDTQGQAMGHTQGTDGTMVGFALTPGYETYKGLGWYGVIVQRRAQSATGST